MLFLGRDEDQVLDSKHVDLCLDIDVSKLDLNVVDYLVHVLDCHYTQCLVLKICDRHLSMFKQLRLNLGLQS